MEYAVAINNSQQATWQISKPTMNLYSNRQKASAIENIAARMYFKYHCVVHVRL